jgi:hypothetical protein
VAESRTGKEGWKTEEKVVLAKGKSLAERGEGGEGEGEARRKEGGRVRMMCCTHRHPASTRLGFSEER